MRKEFATQPESASVMDCIIAMTSARAGACVLTHADGTLAGVFTHGDFARAYQADPTCGSQPVAALMTKNPVFVEADKLAITAVKTLRDRRIDDLVVLDADHKPVGLIDTQDLVRLKLI
jgi:arabinose-5-phosphate isomerase